MFSMDDMVPKDHMLQKIDRAIDWNFIYDLVEDKYCADNGRPSMAPVPHFSTFGKNYTCRFKNTARLNRSFPYPGTMHEIPSGRYIHCVYRFYPCKSLR